MMLATWLIEFYLSMCNELEDVIASESVSHDVENLRVELAERQDELRQFFDTYKVSLFYFLVYDVPNFELFRLTWIPKRPMSSYKAMVGPTYICTTPW